MSKQIDFSKTVYDLCQQDPEIIGIMKDLGFDSITNPAMLKTAGRFMTIPKGAQMKSIPLEKIKAAFESKGYQILE
ncbi:MAG TPA: DUF1858 domain-containing protein [Clostridiales bacterium]|nr:DUF1858 domain-containing protein [Clostridiales bacterium]